MLTSLNWIARTMAELDPAVLAILKITCVPVTGVLMYFLIREQRKLMYVRKFARYSRKWAN